MIRRSSAVLGRPERRGWSAICYDSAGYVPRKVANLRQPLRCPCSIERFRRLKCFSTDGKRSQLIVRSLARIRIARNPRCPAGASWMEPDVSSAFSPGANRYKAATAAHPVRQTSRHWCGNSLAVVDMTAALPANLPEQPACFPARKHTSGLRSRAKHQSSLRLKRRPQLGLNESERQA